MTRKHYEKLAKVLGEAYVAYEQVYEIANILEDANKAFNRTKFIAAVALAQREFAGISAEAEFNNVD